MPSVPQSRLNGEPNVTPFLDVLLVLLIMFMYLCLNQQTLINAQLPDPRASGGGAPTIVLEVKPNAGYAINQQPVAAAELAERLRAIYAARNDKTLIVRGDRGVRYQDVITAIDVARGAGVVAIGVK